MTWFEADDLDRERWAPLVEPHLERVVRARERGRFPQALLLIGPSHLGRELAAVETAALLACEGLDRPWQEDPAADRVRRGLHPDVVAVLPTGKSEVIKIEQVREVVENAPGRPYEGVRRVWILDGVEKGRFGAEAANAFLKILEEPPDHVRFLLLAANPSAVLPTIRSRCQLQSLPGAVAVAEHLGENVPPELAAAIVAHGDIDEALSEVSQALDAAFVDDPRLLLRLPHRLAADMSPFELTAAVAMGRVGSGDREGEELARLASDLLATERRARALNLNRDRQLTSCLLRWYQGLGDE